MLIEGRDWHYEAQQRRYLHHGADEPRSDDTIPEEDEDGFESPVEHSADDLKESVVDSPNSAPATNAH